MRSLPQGDLLCPLQAHSDDDVYSLAISPDSRLLATDGDNGGVRVWDLRDGSHLTTVTGLTDPVRYLAFSPDGNLLGASDDKSIRLWNLDALRLHAMLTDPIACLTPRDIAVVRRICDTDNLHDDQRPWAEFVQLLTADRMSEDGDADLQQGTRDAGARCGCGRKRWWQFW